MCIVHLLLEFLPLLEQDIQSLGEDADRHRVFGRLDIGADGLAGDDTLVVLVVVGDLLECVSLRGELGELLLGVALALRLDATTFAVEHSNRDQSVRTEIVGDHVRRIETVEIQNRDRLVEIHTDLGRKDDGALVARIKVQRMLYSQNLITLRGVVEHRTEDLDALAPSENILHRNLADICHTTSIDNRVQLRHQREHEITILNTVLRNPCPTRRTARSV